MRTPYDRRQSLAPVGMRRSRGSYRLVEAGDPELHDNFAVLLEDRGELEEAAGAPTLLP